MGVYGLFIVAYYKPDRLEVHRRNFRRDLVHAAFCAGGATR